MNKNRRSPSPLLLLVIFLLLFGIDKPLLAAEGCTALLTDHCEKCHYLTRVCDKVLEHKGKWSWKRTVKNMVRQGAKLDDAEQDKLVDCLSEPAPEVRQLCSKNK
jgi:hypothetical protein